MEKNIKDYLHYYIGQEAKMPGYTVVISNSLLADEHAMMHWGIKPILRKLGSITDEEAEDLARLETPKFRWDDIEVLNIHPAEIHFMDGSKWYGDGVEEYNDCYVNLTQLTPGVFHYLLSKGFDLFGLLESGLAIEKQPTTQNQGV